MVGSQENVETDADQEPRFLLNFFSCSYGKGWRWCRNMPKDPYGRSKKEIMNEKPKDLKMVERWVMLKQCRRGWNRAGVVLDRSQ